MKSYAGFLAYRLKMESADFCVSEISDLPLLSSNKDSTGDGQKPSTGASASPGKRGAKRNQRATDHYSVYSLQKDGWNTVDVLLKTAARFKIPIRDILYGGKKDRHARTQQWITAPPSPDLTHSTDAYSLEYVGTSSKPMGPENIAGNRFTLTVRNILERETTQVEAGARRLKQLGFPNYFDDQRFGSFHPLVGFPFLCLFRGDPESALRYTLLSAFGGDKPHAKKRKKAINDVWGQWDRCLKLAHTKTEEAILQQLKKQNCNSGDLSSESRKAFTRLLDRLPREELSMGFSALQSWIFNESVSRLFRFIQNPGREVQRPFSGKNFKAVEIKTKTGDQCFPFSIPESLGKVLNTMELQLLGPGRKEQSRVDSKRPSGEILASTLTENSSEADLSLAIQEIYYSSENQVLNILEIPEESFQRSYLERAFLKSYSRPIWCVPEEMTWSDFEKDELNDGKLKYTVEFTLPRGTYATMAMKALHLRLKQ
ncbi:MAG: tRNA pseudouridine(13) synthase TruD [Leptospiraceae bacterium]